MPIGFGLKPQCFTSIIAMMYNTPVKLHWNLFQSPYIHDSRNRIVEAAKEEKATHLMFIDNDMEFPADGIMQLLSHDKDIVAGAYSMKVKELNGTIKILKDGKYGTIDSPPKVLFMCDAAPTGFMLINMRVFENMEFPYFYTCYHDGELMGEDVYFCKKAKESGAELWCDGSIKLGHVGDYTYNLSGRI
jgi:hypothetical protein